MDPKYIRIKSVDLSQLAELIYLRSMEQEPNVDILSEHVRELIEVAKDIKVELEKEPEEITNGR